MDYFEDEIIEEEISSTINFIELKQKLKAELKELHSAIEKKNEQKIKTIFNNIDEFLEWYW